MRKILIAFSALFFLSIVFIFVNYLSKTSVAPVTSPKPISSDLSQEYSNLNKTLPGKSTISDVIRINGSPVSTRSEGQKTYLYFQTPIFNVVNIVAFKSGVELYALENVYGQYRGSYDNFTKAYGQPNLTLYDHTNSLPWYVFLQNGIGVQTNGKNISKILYFFPQDENSFIDSVAKDVGLFKESPSPEVLR